MPLRSVREAVWSRPANSSAASRIVSMSTRVNSSRPNRCGPAQLIFPPNLPSFDERAAGQCLRPLPRRQDHFAADDCVLHAQSEFLASFVGRAILDAAGVEDNHVGDHFFAKQAAFFQAES